MKKLMIAASLVCAAAMVQAGSVTWGSGNFYMPESTAGGWAAADSANLVKNNSQAVTMSLWLIEAGAYDTIKDYSQADLYAYAKGLGKDADATGSTFTPGEGIEPGVYANAKNLSTDGAQNKTYYAVLVSDMSVASGNLKGDYYMAAVASTTAGTTGDGSVNNIFGGKKTATTNAGVRDWQTVSEPTSAMLLLLGVAGLALKRKRA